GVEGVHAGQKGQHGSADIFRTVREKVGPRMAIIVIEDDHRSVRERCHGFADGLGRLPLIACQHQDSRSERPERSGLQAGGTDERQGSNGPWMRSSEAMPISGHTRCDMYLRETQVPKKLYQSPVNRTLCVACHILAPCSTTVTLLLSIPSAG